MTSAGSPCISVPASAGTRSDGVVVPALPLLVEGYPLRVLPDDRVEIDSDATPQRRREVNAERVRRCYPLINGLEGPGWQARVRRQLTNAQRPSD
ncbi:MAG: hypothetical protein QOG95_508 [Mycobacterium sp.]|jgi:hypothetical protein|nr:hypothetical protein [Mycobacterium sp.]